MSSNDRCIVISTSKPIPKKGCDEDKDSQPPPEAANHSHESYAGPFTGEANWYVICVNGVCYVATEGDCGRCISTV